MIQAPTMTISAPYVDFVSNFVERKIAVIHGFLFYKSSGRNSGFQETWFPFKGILEKGNLERGLSPGWFIKSPHITKDLFDYLLPFIKEDWVTYRELPIRFGTMAGLLVSAKLGGGFWDTEKGNEIKAQLQLDFPKFFQNIHVEFQGGDSEGSNKMIHENQELIDWIRLQTGLEPGVECAIPETLEEFQLGNKNLPLTQVNSQEKYNQNQVLDMLREHAEQDAKRKLEEEDRLREEAFKKRHTPASTETNRKSWVSWILPLGVLAASGFILTSGASFALGALTVSSITAATMLTGISIGVSVWKLKVRAQTQDAPVDMEPDTTPKVEMDLKKYNIESEFGQTKASLFLPSQGGRMRAQDQSHEERTAGVKAHEGLRLR